MEAARSLGNLSSDPAHNSYLSSSPSSTPSLPSSSPISTSTATTLGLLQHTFFPALNLHASLSLATYTLGRLTRRLDTKDLLWPTGLLANAWFNALLVPAHRAHLPYSTLLSSLSWSQKLLLGGVTAWSTRLLYRITTRCLKRGEDDARYKATAAEPSFWDKAFFTVYLPEAVFQSLISLSWAAALQTLAPSVPSAYAPPNEWSQVLHSVAVGLWCVGFTMESLADWQLERHAQSDGADDLKTDGVWSIVRHPNYLGDTLVHLSFPLLLFASSASSSSSYFTPITLLGPLANYIFLRHLGGDAENERAQEQRYKAQNPKKYAQLEAYRESKNAFWPTLKDVLLNKWAWALGAMGVAGAGLESVLRVRYA